MKGLCEREGFAAGTGPSAVRCLAWGAGFGNDSRVVAQGCAGRAGSDFSNSLLPLAKKAGQRSLHRPVLIAERFGFFARKEPTLMGTNNSRCLRASHGHKENPMERSCVSRYAVASLLAALLL